MKSQQRHFSHFSAPGAYLPAEQDRLQLAKGTTWCCGVPCRYTSILPPESEEVSLKEAQDKVGAGTAQRGSSTGTAGQHAEIALVPGLVAEEAWPACLREWGSKHLLAHLCCYSPER